MSVIRYYTAWNEELYAAISQLPSVNFHLPTPICHLLSPIRQPPDSKPYILSKGLLTPKPGFCITCR